MINKILFTVAERPIYASAAMITLGVFLCVLLTLALYRGRSENSTAVWALFCLGFVLAVFFSRLLHWYFNSETYGSFAVAFTDFSVGSFCIPGVILGVWLAACSRAPQPSASGVRWVRKVLLRSSRSRLVVG